MTSLTGTCRRADYVTDDYYDKNQSRDEATSLSGQDKGRLDRLGEVIHDLIKLLS